MVRIDDVLSPYNLFTQGKKVKTSIRTSTDNFKISEDEKSVPVTDGMGFNPDNGIIDVVNGLWPDEEFESKEALYRKIAEEYDMEHLPNDGVITEILATLREKGILTTGEFVMACCPTPVFQDMDMYHSYHSSGITWQDGVYNPEYNALTEYKGEYVDYINQYCQNVKPTVADTLQKAMAVVNKVDGILHEIQSYRK